MSAPEWVEKVLAEHQTEQLWKAGGWAGDTACSCGWRMAMWTKKDFPPVHRAHVAAVLWAEFTARARQAREDVAEGLNHHMSDRDHDQGCAIRCGYDGDDRDEHLADAAIAALLTAMGGGL